MIDPKKMEKGVEVRKSIALVAHDNKKKELIEWAIKSKKELTKHNLCATGTTGKLLESKINLPINKLLSGPLGGDLQIGTMIAEGKLDLLIFFWDPLQAQPHDPDVKALLRIAVVYNLPVACNTASADFILTSQHFHGLYERKMPDFTNYENRNV